MIIRIGKEGPEITGLVYSGVTPFTVASLGKNGSVNVELCFKNRTVAIRLSQNDLELLDCEVGEELRATIHPSHSYIRQREFEEEGSGAAPTGPAPAMEEESPEEEESTSLKWEDRKRWFEDGAKLFGGASATDSKIEMWFTGLRRIEEGGG